MTYFSVANSFVSFEAIRAMIFTTSHELFWIMLSGCQNLNQIVKARANWNSICQTLQHVPADGLAIEGAKPSAGSDGQGLYSLNTLRPRQNGRLFADDIFTCIFLNENVWISIKISLKFLPEGLINNIPALVQIMAWRRLSDKPLSEAMMVR